MRYVNPCRWPNTWAFELLCWDEWFEEWRNAIREMVERITR